MFPRLYSSLPATFTTDASRFLISDAGSTQLSLHPRARSRCRSKFEETKGSLYTDTRCCVFAAGAPLAVTVSERHWQSKMKETLLTLGLLGSIVLVLTVFLFIFGLLPSIDRSNIHTKPTDYHGA
ncbi:hypothetical protein BDV98DRAFT_563950 [Pterulicium gracile]|uniref:Uncharacterized protein n=1 Tax=Pterulicium gracile TaxID=1884261 RepID=A0A5C3QR29_9AGAR|nr:hypothetical protein BDV98DRAFT_563950 [Pterula gracilis]